MTHGLAERSYLLLDSLVCCAVPGLRTRMLCKHNFAGRTSQELEGVYSYRRIFFLDPGMRAAPW